MTVLEDRDFVLYPKFRHNLWLRSEDCPELTYLTVSNGVYEVPSEQADKFLSIRSYCTGYNTVEEISRRSGVCVEEIKQIVAPFQEAHITHPRIRKIDLLSEKNVEKALLTLSELFGEHLAETNITLDILSGKLKKEAVLGWLCETYHYIKFFPDTLRIALTHAKGKMRKIIEKYAQQEDGHESFILKTLTAIGFSKEEIEKSVPLVSTKTIKFILEDLFSYEPASVFIVASIIESAQYDDFSRRKFAKTMQKIYEFPLKMWDPFFKHIEIDSEFQHQQLLRENIFFVRKINKNKLNDMVNKLHDLKHAFDLQKLEIINHYSNLGSYIPRQFVNFFSI